MEDLLPVLIFIVIAIINIAKFKAEKKGKTEHAPEAQGDALPKRQPSSLEEFFQELTEKFEPKPTPLPDWPEGYERPGYMREMEEFEEEKPVAPVPVPVQSKAAPPPVARTIDKKEMPRIRAQGQTTIFKLPVQGAVFAGLSGMQLSTPSILRSATGQIDFDLASRKKLKQALIASMVFGQPRAYDSSFDNTIAK